MMKNKNAIANEDLFFTSQSNLLGEDSFDPCPCCGNPLWLAMDKEGDYANTYCQKCGDVSKLCEDMYKEKSLNLNTTHKQ